MSVEPELISLLDRAVLKIEIIDGKGDAAEIPDVDGLKIAYRGPQTQYSFVNGRSSSSITHTYLITPTKVGDYTIGPVKVKFNGSEKELSTKLRVIKPQDDAEAQQISQMMFSQITTDRPSPYVHEPFQLDLKVYVRDGVEIDGNFGIRGGIPESGMDGELEWTVSRRQREERNGVIFNVYSMRATAKALTAGTFTFSPEVQLNVVVPRQQRRSYGFDDPFFGDFFGRQETRPIRLECNILDIEVQPIPIENRPPSFTGGVGKLDFNVEVGPKKLKTGEPITVKMRISGSGNLEKIMPPQMKEEPGIKRYDVNTVPSDNPNEILFEQVIIPTTDAITELPPITFSYFNTQTADFRTETAGPFPIEVEAAPQQVATVMGNLAPAAQSETKVLGSDIAYLKPRPPKWIFKHHARLFESLEFRIAMALPPLLLILTFVAVGRRNRLEKDTALARRQKAPKAARQTIQRAEQAMKKQDAQAFYEAMWNTLETYFGHRLNLARGQVTKQIVVDHIPAEAEMLEQLFDGIEHRRYGMQTETHSTDEMKRLLKQMVETLKRCERMKL